MIAKQFGHSVSTSAALVRCFLSAVIRTYEKRGSKDRKTVSGQQGHEQPWIINLDGGQRLICVVQTSRSSAVAQIVNLLMLVLIEVLEHVVQ